MHPCGAAFDKLRQIFQPSGRIAQGNLQRFPFVGFGEAAGSFRQLAYQRLKLRALLAGLRGLIG